MPVRRPGSVPGVHLCLNLPFAAHARECPIAWEDQVSLSVSHRHVTRTGSSRTIVVAACC